MNREIDARGKACPEPVIITKKELDKIDSGSVITIVDNEIAKENVSKLANSLGHQYTVDKRDEDEYHIHIIKGQGSGVIREVSKDDIEDITIACTSDTMGKGSEELGEILIKSLFYTMTELTPYPSTVILYNGGVHLACEGSEVLDDLKHLEENGVEIISCGTCLDYFEIADKLRVGEVSNMYTIYEKLKESTKLVNIG
ncbi:MAG: sulfurtransferase-like selenium metabolism protein YedF [Tissierellia bacterium]|nr:sulfurtransferase-like selenium metabolism protein YedF [Tissierellia bacterium]